jgi:hypothetical protein
MDRLYYKKKKLSKKFVYIDEMEGTLYQRKLVFNLLSKT